MKQTWKLAVLGLLGSSANADQNGCDKMPGKCNWAGIVEFAFTGYSEPISTEILSYYVMAMNMKKEKA